MIRQRGSGRAARPVTAGTVGLAAVVLIAAGVTAGALARQGGLSTPVAAPAGEQAVRVSTQAFNDARTVTAEAAVTDPKTLTVAAAGRITSFDCAGGVAITSGSSPLRLDNRPVLALATSMPLWRDLAAGARGDDVIALQAELARLGYEVEPDGAFGAATTSAVKAMEAAAGVARPTGDVRAAWVMWLPGPQVTVSSCDAQVGDQNSGRPVATIGGGLVGLRLTSDLSDAVPGARVLLYRGMSAPVDPDGQVSDTQFLSALATGPEAALAMSGNGSLSVQYALATAVQVAVIPPGALYGLSGNTGCIVADGQPRSVTVVSSALGQTMVTLREGTVPAQVSTEPNPTGTCR